MKKVLLICLILLVGSSTFVCAYESIVQGSYSNVELNINERYVGDKDVSNPLINVDGNTYMSVRDWGRFSDMDVSWDEKNNSIMMSTNNQISVDKDTALTIGKAIIQDTYKDRLTENTKYKITKGIADCIGARPFYVIYVCFNPEDGIGDDLSKMNRMADVYVTFHEYLSDIEIIERNKNN